MAAVTDTRCRLEPPVPFCPRGHTGRGTPAPEQGEVSSESRSPWALLAPPACEGRVADAATPLAQAVTRHRASAA